MIKCFASTILITLLGWTLTGASAQTTAPATAPASTQPSADAQPAAAPTSAPSPTEAAFDPAAYVNATPEELMRLTPEQRRGVARYKASQRRSPARSGQSE